MASRGTLQRDGQAEQRSSWAGPTAPSGRRPPSAPRERKPAPAALAILLIAGGALGAGYLVLSNSKRVEAIEVSSVIEAGEKIPLSALTEVQVPQNTNLQFVPWTEVQQVTQFRAKTLYPGTLFTRPMAALLDIARRYMIDLADSTTYQGPNSEVIHYGGGTTGPWVLKIVATSDGTSPLSSFLQQIMSDNADGKALKATTITAMAQYYALWAQNKTPPQMTEPDLAMAKLYAREMVEADNVSLNTAVLTDQQDQQINNEIDFAKQAVTWIPGVGSYAGQGESLLGLSGVTMDLPTDTAVAVQQSNDRDLAVNLTTIGVPMVQAMINAGAVPSKDLSGTSSWLINGRIDLTANPNSAADFSAVGR